jgi:predicted DNA-binding transcriptional regulator YafY
MNRFNRILAIFVQLQSKKIVKASEIAARFHISLRTVYRDIRSLEESGVPIIGEAGTGYSLVDGYRLPPVMFTPEEALTFVTAEKLMDRFADHSLIHSYTMAMDKIKAVLKNGDKDYLKELEDRIIVTQNQFSPTRTEHSLQLILTHIIEKRALQMIYFADHSLEETTRIVEPVGIYFLGGRWHLIAFCCLRNDYRNFRTDRIKDLAPTHQEYGRKHPPLKSFLDKTSKEQDLHKVVVKIRKDSYKYIGDQKYYNGFISQKITDNWVEMTFLTASLQGFARWYIMYGDVAQIVKPVELKTEVLNLAQKVIQEIIPS